MWISAYRWSRRLLVVAACLPLMQTAGCIDPTAFAVQLASNFATSVAQQVIVAGAGALIQLLLQSFPGSQILQALLGGNAGFFP